MLYRLIYASEAADDLTPDSVQTLLDNARRRNRLRDISGMLVFDSRYFLQVIEGDRQVLSDLYGKLVQDTRHQRLLLIGFEPIVHRTFSDWSMGFAAADAQRRRLYLRHSPSARFEPHSLNATSALALLTELSHEAELETEN
jgi:hypothetical protein